MMELTWLATTGASAIVSAMVTPAWEWARSRLAGLFSREHGREEVESECLSSFAAELEKTTERDVQNQLRGFLLARLRDDPELMADFAGVVKEICDEIGLQPPTEWTSYVNAPTSVWVVAGRDADVSVGQVRTQGAYIAWAALTTQEAARKLEGLDHSDAVVELAGMDPASAARRLAHVDKTKAAGLLSHMDEPLAADLLTRITAPYAAELMALMTPKQGAAVLETMNPDWVVARLSEMEPDRALVLFSALGTKRVDDLLAAMQRQQAVRLLSSVGKVLVQQAQLRTNVDMAEEEAKRIVAQAQEQAERVLDQARREADEVKTTAAETPRPDDIAEPVDDGQQMLMRRIYGILTAQPDGRPISARAVSSKAGVTLAAAKSLLIRLEQSGKVARTHRAQLYYARPDV
jgi:hypothetical protein